MNAIETAVQKATVYGLVEDAELGKKLLSRLIGLTG